MTIDISSLNSALELGDANLARLDSAVNDPAGTWTDKDGNVLDNLQQRFADVGYKVPVAYTDGLSVTDGSFTVTESGLVYAADPAETPFTSGVTFDSNKWLLIPSFTGPVSFTSINSTPIGNTTPSTGVFTTLESEGAITAAFRMTASNATLTTNNPELVFEDTNTSNAGRIVLNNTSINVEVDNLDSVADSVFKIRVDDTDQVEVNASGDVTATGALSAATVAGDMIATQAEAEAGTATNKLMNPLRVKQAIDALSANAADWEPFDSATATWDADGDAVLYDSASDGTLAIVTTPASTDEYEYTIEIDGLVHNSPGDRNLLYRITYSDATTEDTALYNSVPTATAVSGRNIVGSHNPIFFLASDVTTKRVSQVSVLFNSASMSSGVVRVWRRRAAFVAS